MQILTAIELADLAHDQIDRWSHQLVCPWCGEDAWATADYMQCYNSSCATQAASPEDILAKVCGDDYHQAATFAARHLRAPVDDIAITRRIRERAVMDLWLSFCATPSNSESLQITNRVQEMGFGIKQSRFNALALDSRQVRELIQVADETGAAFPESWLENPPGATRAFCVQSKPHTIDRVILMSPTGRTAEIVWHRYSAGFIALLGLMPHRPRLLAAGVDVALQIQYELATMGQYEEVASIYTDLWSGDNNPRWEVNLHLLTAVPRHCEPQLDPNLYGPKDLVHIQHTLDQFPGIERSVKATPIDYVMDMRPRDQVTSWSNLRFGMLAGAIHKQDTQMNPTAATLFEQLGSRPEDSARLISRFTRAGRLALCADISRLSMTRTIHRDANMSVKETATDYRLIRGADTRTLANFSLKVASNVSFRNQPDASYCHATLRCGAAELEVLFPQSLLGDRVQALQDEMQRQLTIQDKTTEAGRLPTIIESTPVRKYVMPHLRGQVSDARTVVGIDLLGWSSDRRTFSFPGFRVGLDGVKKTSRLFCPSVQVLKHFQAVDEWAEGCPASLDRSCREITAMMLASTVRYFRRCVTKPVYIAQSSDAMTVLDRFSKGLGQRELHELNQNLRDGSRIEGIHGYPILAAGPRSAVPVTSQAPYFHLTDSGYKLPTSPDPQQAAKGARAAQFCLQRVVEWCISTGGDAFQEVSSLVYHRALLREGHWLIENVVELDDWESPDASVTALEHLLEQIPYEDTRSRITLIDGTDMIIDVQGIDRDHDAVMREAKEMGTVVAIEDDKLMASAVKLLPAIATYYGQDPDVNAVSS